MPKKSNISKKKRSYKKKTSLKKRWLNIMGMESKKPELKCVDVNGAGAGVTASLLSTTATVTLLNGLATGAAYFQRVGRSVSLKSLHLRGCILPSGLDGVTGEFIRISLVYDRQPNGALPAYADIFQTVDAAGNGSNAVFDFTNLNNSERFLILADIPVQFSSTEITGAAHIASASEMQNQMQSLLIDKYISLDGLPTNYKLDTAVIGAISSGAIYLVTMGSAAAANAGTAFNWSNRIRYSDV